MPGIPIQELLFDIVLVFIEHASKITTIPTPFYGFTLDLRASRPPMCAPFLKI